MLRLAIATPNRDQYSETFITAHLERLKEVVLVLSEGSLPQNANGISLLMPRSFTGRVHNIWAQRMVRLDHRAILRKRIASALRRQRVQVLLAEYGPTGEALVDSAREAGVPLVVHFHGYDAHKQAIMERYNNYKRLFGSAAALVVVSRAMEQHLLALGAPREKLHYIVYGIDVGQFPPGDPSQAPAHFLGVGRFTDKKAPQLTLLAFREAWRRRPEARLTLVGTGDLRESVRQLVVALGLEHVVDLPGVLRPEQIAERMRHARAFVQHSVTTAGNDMEGTPLAVLEAMASGLPVISTRHAGIPDVVAHGERGLLGPEYDVETMAGHMVQLIDRPGQAAEMGLAGRAYVMAHHRVEDRINALQELLERAARERSSIPLG